MTFFKGYYYVQNIDILKDGGYSITYIPSVGYIWETYGCGFEYQQYRWDTEDFPIHWKQGNLTGDCSGENTAIANAFNTWESEPYSTIDFTYDGYNYTVNSHSDDGIHFVFFDGDGCSPSEIAKFWRYETNKVIDGFDIEFNDNYVDWRTSGISGKYDVESVALHDFGHAIDIHDLYNSVNQYETMYYAPPTGAHRTLGDGDKAGVQWIYPYDSQPSVSITAPSDGAEVSSPIYITASVTCDDSISQVKFKATVYTGFSYDSGWITMTYSGGSWSGTWTTTRTGYHYITVCAMSNRCVYSYDTHYVNVLGD